MPKDHDRFYAQDLYLSAWLIANGEPVLEVEYYRPTGRAIFWFPNGPNVQRLLRLYHEGSAYIQLRPFMDAHRKVIYMVGQARRADAEGEVA